MKTSIVLLAASSLVAFTAGSGASAPPVPASVSLCADDFASLVASYDEAEDAWRARIREAEAEERRELRKDPPAAHYWARFEALAQADEGRATLWMIAHLRDKGLKTAEVEEQQPVLYARLFERHVGAEWFGDVLERLPRDKRYLGAPQIVAFYQQAIDGSEVAAVRAQAMYQLGTLLMDSEDESEKTAGKGWLEKAAAEYPETDHGTMARGELYKPVVGELAPDFAAATIDGYEFKLSDYRGKVVLLDFYGFW